MRKFRRKLVFDKFCAETRIADIDRAAFRADSRRLFSPAAIMAAEPSFFFVERHRNGAVLAEKLITACLASEKMSEAAPVQEQYRLALFFISFVYFFFKLRRNAAGQVFF